jgi:transposase
VEERSREANRLQKVLEDSNLKLASVVSDILGVSAKAILNKLLEGEKDPLVLAELARGRLREKKELLIQALAGELKAHHRFMVAELLGHIDYLDETIKRLGEEVARRLDPFEEQIAQLDTIPGVNRRVAEIILAEVGAKMEQFGDAKHLASWAGLCPGNKESGGKRLSGKIRKGNAALRKALTEAAQAAARTKNTFLSQLYRRLAARRGKKVAMVAVAHRLLVIVYQVLSKGEAYKELASENKQRTQSEETKFRERMVRRLEKLGYEVSLKQAG